MSSSATNNCVHRFGRTHILYDQNLVSRISPGDFKGSAQTKVNQLGRTAAHYIELQGRACVLKQYRRGGLVRHLTSKLYVFQGLGNSRMWQEFKLLQTLRAKGLPVPRPVAALCDVHPSMPLLPSMCYSGSLITERIDHTCTLAESLEQQAMDIDEWQQVGQLIRRFHDQQLYHADLNANNILWQERKQLFLIDFDKSHLKPAEADASWKQANLDRLLRSLRKLQPRFFEESGWLKLLDGYQTPTDHPSSPVID